MVPLWVRWEAGTKYMYEISRLVRDNKYARTWQFYKKLYLAQESTEPIDNTR